MRSIVQAAISSPLFIISWMIVLFMTLPATPIFAGCGSTDTRKHIAVVFQDSNNNRWGPVVDGCIPAGRSGVSATIMPDVAGFGNEAQFVSWTCPGGGLFAGGTYDISSKQCSYATLSGAGGEMGINVALPGGYQCADIQWDYRLDAASPIVETGNGSCSIVPHLIDSPTRNSLLTVKIDRKGWPKFKDTSFHKNNNLKFTLPATMNPYVNGDPDDNTMNVLIAGQGGVVSSSTSIDLKPVTDKFSTNNLRTQATMTPIRTFLSNLNSFTVDSVHNQKVNFINYTTDIKPNAINVLDPPGAMYGMEYIETNAASPLPTGIGPYVLIVRGGLHFMPGAYVFNPGPNYSSIALIATEGIEIDPAYGEINAIMIANFIDIAKGRTPTNPGTIALKVNGNFISNVNFNELSRKRPDPSRPSLFVVFRPKMYIDLLPYLSTIERKGSQLQ